MNISVNGDGDITPLSGTYKRGTNIIFTATEGSGYLFTGWYGDLSSTPVNMNLTTNVLISTNLNIVGAFSDDADGDGLTNTKENDLGSNPWLLDSDGDGVDDPTEAAMTNMVFTFDPLHNSSSDIDRFQEVVDQIPGMMGDSMMEVRGGYIRISIDDNQASIEIPIEASMDSSDWDHMGTVNITRPLTNDVEFFELEFD